MRIPAILGAALVVVVAAAAPARAGYEDEQNDKHMGVIERAFAKYKENPSIFDGKRLAGALDAARDHAIACDGAVDAYDRYFRQVSAKGRGTDRARALTARYEQLQPWCAALRKAVDAAVAEAKAKAEQEARAAAELQQRCQTLQREASDAVGGVGLHDVLDTWSGGMTPTHADHVREFRGKLEKVAAVCARPAHADAARACEGRGILQSSATNRRYDQGDICKAAGDPSKTLREVAERLLAYRQKHAEAGAPVTIEAFRDKEGWLPSTDIVSYATYFVVPEDHKRTLIAEVREAFDAAGVPPPEDVSHLWESLRVHLASLKAAVDATAGEWKVTLKKCSGYTCKLAEKQVTKHQPKAKIKKTFQREWKIVKNSIDVPVKRYLDMQVLYQIPGEPYCQLRSLTAYEDYKGGGKYQKATGAAWGFVRFQRC